MNQHKHVQFFDPDANYDFVGRRRFYYALTGVGILVSIVAIALLGFNKGIDFKGGTKLIVAFAPDAKVDRAELKGNVEQVLATATGTKEGTHVDVQEFSAGSGAGDDQNFAVVTELTKAVPDARREALSKALAAQFAKAEIAWVEEGEDRVFVTLPDAAKVPETYAALQKVFADAGFPKTKTSSDVEVQLDVNLFRQLQMSQLEGDKTHDQLVAEEKTLRDQKDAELQDKTDTRFSIVVEEFKSKIEEGIKQKYGPAFKGVVSSTAVSPSVAGDLLGQGLVAVLYAIIGIVLYVILRFDVRYAPGVLVALLHDVVLVIGAFSIAQVKFSMPVIAAVLTVAGYSVTDTIVVFDRIRETQAKNPGVPIETVVNAAINHTMSRTVLTALTTFMASLAIFLFGGGLIRDFAFAMCIGVIVGIFSSVFVASPMFVALHHYFEKRESRRPEPTSATA